MSELKYSDLHAHIAELDKQGLLLRVKRPINKDIPRCTRWCAGNFAVVFRRSAQRVPVRERHRQQGRK
jgi:hypothetical protein